MYRSCKVIIIVLPYHHFSIFITINNSISSRQSSYCDRPALVKSYSKSWDATKHAGRRDWKDIALEVEK